MADLSRLLCGALQAYLEGGQAPVPEAGKILWRAFAGLSGRRTWHASGPNPVAYSEMESYCRLMRLPLPPHHIEVLAAMDAVWIAHVQAQLADKMAGSTQDAGKPRGPVMSKHSLTTDLFDAMFG